MHHAALHASDNHLANCKIYVTPCRLPSAGVETATKKWGGETLPHLLATSPGLPLLFLEYIMQKGKKNEERNLNAWDRSFEKLDSATQIKLIVVVNINHTAHTRTHSQYIYPWLRPVKSGGGSAPPLFRVGGRPPPLPPPMSPPLL